MTCGCQQGAKKSTKFLGMEFKDCGCGCGGAKGYEKFMISVLSAVIFYIVAHPKTFKIMRGFLGDWVSSAGGCPSLIGLLLHSIVFLFIVWGLMNIKKYNN